MTTYQVTVAFRVEAADASEAIERFDAEAMRLDQSYYDIAYVGITVARPASEGFHLQRVT